MSTALLYHAFNLSDVKFLSANFMSNKVSINLKVNNSLLKCSICNSKNLHKRGSSFRKIRTIPIGSRAVELLLDIPKVFCKKCNILS